MKVAGCDMPAREARYLPDFRVGNIIIETKGWFGRNGARERQKLVLLKEQHPDLDIRIVFSDARKPLYKGSPTTYAMWATDHGFTYSTKGIVPQRWIVHLKREQSNVTKRCKRS
jgi:Phage endonuclease I